MRMKKGSDEISSSLGRPLEGYCLRGIVVATGLTEDDLVVTFLAGAGAFLGTADTSGSGAGVGATAGCSADVGAVVIASGATSDLMPTTPRAVLVLLTDIRPARAIALLLFGSSAPVAERVRLFPHSTVF